MSLETVITLAIAVLVGIAVPLYSLHKGQKFQLRLKELDDDAREAEIRRDLQREVMMRSLETVQRSFYHVRRVNRLLSACIATKSKNTEELQSALQEATEYWENSYCFLPEQIRERFILLTNLVGSSTHPAAAEQGIQFKAFDEISAMMDSIKNITVEYMDTVNPLNLENDSD